MSAWNYSRLVLALGCGAAFVLFAAHEGMSWKSGVLAALNAAVWFCSELLSQSSAKLSAKVRILLDLAK